MVPVSVPTLPRCDTTTFTPDACHTDLHRNRYHHIRTLLGPTNNVFQPQNAYSEDFEFIRNVSLPRLSSSCFVLDNWVPDRRYDNSSGIVHTPIMAAGDTKSVTITD